MKQRTGLAATLSILAALGGYVLVCTGRPGWGLLCELVAIPLGALGLLFSASPRVSGGMLSIAAMMLAGIGVVVAVLALVGTIVF